jgi:hypothetical protein
VYSLAERVSILELKHNTEQTVASIDQETLRKVARKTLKRVDACIFDKVVDIFSICCEAIL